MTAARRRRPARRPTMFLDADGKPLGMLRRRRLRHLGRRARRRRHAGAGAQGARQAAVARAVPAGDRQRRARASRCRRGWPAGCSACRRDDPDIRAVYFNADGSPKKQGERIANPALAETMRLIAEQGARAFYEGDIAARDGGAGAQACAAGHAVAGRSRQLQADQARAGVRSLSRLDRLRHAAAVVGRHRHPAGAGPARTVRAVARQARRPARAASHRRGEPARLRRPRPLRRRSGVRARCRWPACCRRPTSPSAAS